MAAAVWAICTKHDHWRSHSPEQQTPNRLTGWGFFIAVSACRSGDSCVRLGEIRVRFDLHQQIRAADVRHHVNRRDHAEAALAAGLGVNAGQGCATYGGTSGNFTSCVGGLDGGSYCDDNADCDTCSCCAARVRWPSRATTQK